MKKSNNDTPHLSVVKTQSSEKKNHWSTMPNPDERYLPMSDHARIDPMFPNLVRLESQKDAIKLIEIFKIGRGYYMAEKLGVSTLHENSAAMGVWVEEQRRNHPYEHFDDLVDRIIDCYESHNNRVECKRKAAELASAMKVIELQYCNLANIYKHSRQRLEEKRQRERAEMLAQEKQRKTQQKEQEND